jgi:transposase
VRFKVHEGHARESLESRELRKVNTRTHKAKLVGIPVLFVDPRDTSRRCSRCGHVDKRSRVSQSGFRCCLCGYELNADLNAAENVR